ncbi:kinesin family protein [Ceratobasidium sp. AG-Ba]|nr:kinesin family protein [Ceratobasidium sp. AG-Ba]
MATGMNPTYDFLYAPSSSSIHQPHTPGSDPSLATEIMPAPPPLTGIFPRVNDKGQALTRGGKVSNRKKPPGIGAIVAHVSRQQQHQRSVLPAAPVVVDHPSPAPVAPDVEEFTEDTTTMAESSGARKRMRLSRQPSVPTSLGDGASPRPLRNSPLTNDPDSMTPEAVGSPQAAPTTDLEPSVTAMVNGTSPRMSLAPHVQPKRPRGKKSHAHASALATRDTALAPTGVKPEPTDDPFISHTDGDPLPPPVDVYDSSFTTTSARFDGMQLGAVHRMPSVKPALSSRRKGKGKDTGLELGDHDGDGYPQSNNVACECCSLQGGHLVFCDGCPRSFHLLCLNPPLDELQEETWYCQSCIAKRNGVKPLPPKFRLETSTKRVNPNTLFDDLMHNLTIESPKTFTLPEDIRNHFKDGKSNTGAYVESGDVVRERLSRHGFVEERDPYRLRDRHGAMVLCCKCGMSASSSTMTDEAQDTGDFSPRGRPIISCDYCRLHWHMDCLDPPLAVLPVNGRRWMCPNHAAHSVPKIRIPKAGSRVVTITKPGQRNNGNIEVIMDSEPLQLIPHVMRSAYEEVRINGQRYRVPEQTIVLDFWKKAKRNRMREVSRASSPAPLTTIRPTTPPQSSLGIATPTSSPLTSLSSLSDHEDHGLENARSQQDQDMGDLAAAELLHAFHVQARSESSPNSIADDNFHTEHSINTRNSSPLSSILSEDPHDYGATVSSIFKREPVESSVSPGSTVSQAPRPVANGIKIIPKAGSFAIRIPASKGPGRPPVVRETSQPRRSGRRRLSSSQPDPPTSNTTGPKPTVLNGQEAGAGGRGSSTSAMEDDLSPAEIAKLKKIKALILAKGEEELMKFLRA